MTYEGADAMKPMKGSSQTPTLIDLIEIIRDPQLPSASERAFPAESDDSDPILSLEKLVAQVEQALDNVNTYEPRVEQNVSETPLKPKRCTSESERYTELFQKQNSVMRRVISKLN